MDNDLALAVRRLLDLLLGLLELVAATACQDNLLRAGLSKRKGLCAADAASGAGDQDGEPFGLAGESLLRRDGVVQVVADLRDERRGALREVCSPEQGKISRRRRWLRLRLESSLGGVHVGSRHRSRPQRVLLVAGSLGSRCVYVHGVLRFV